MSIHGRWLISSAILFVGILGMRSAWAIDLSSSGGFLFDIDDTSSGVLVNGSVDAYDNCYELRINDYIYTSNGQSSLEGRTVRLGQTKMGPLQISRAIFVPDQADRDYARYIDTIENPSDQAVTVLVRYIGNLGSDSSTVVWDTSTGDPVVATDDSWFGTDDDDGSGDPTLAHVFFGVGGRVRPETLTLINDDIDVRFSIEVGARQVVSLMFFGVQGPDRQTVREQVRELLADPGAAMANLSPEHAARVINWPQVGGLPILGELDIIAGQTEPEPVYQASLRLQVTTAEEPMDRAVEIAADLGGRIERRDSTRLVLRVPVEQFRIALGRFEQLGYVLGRSVRIQEGSQRVRDLQLRLRSAEDVRDRLVALARRSPTASEAVAIERQIGRLNELIEQLRSYLEELEERVRFSTIDLQFQETRRVEPIPRNLWRLPFGWIDELGLENLLEVR